MDAATGPEAEAERHDPGEPEILVFPDAAGASRGAAARIAEALTDAVAARGIAHWATTGGSAPAPIYRHLADPPFRDGVPWDRVQLWWGDDRWVPPDDPRSNALACRDILLREVHVPAEHVHPIPVGEAMAAGRPPSWAAQQYEAALRDAGLPVAPSGFPILDLVLVGIGPDGHLFSVFPGSATWDDSAWVQAVPAPSHVEPHVERITLHPRILDVARLPLAVVTGASKAAILGRVFGPRDDERELPSLLARRAGAAWILDEAAAAELPPDVRVTRGAALA
ncbi:MAG TPA: 6-phosphogluconolactonase [Candidatus Limnocylindrales bacterium]|nr:6-phosphogluconolactonase [Candidatus Limnocylindrales bacterium]